MVCAATLGAVTLYFALKTNDWGYVFVLSAPMAFLFWQFGRMAAATRAAQHAGDVEFQTRARIDTVTGLPDRFALREKLNDSTQSPEGGALLMIDLDNFKYLNDTRGHSAGDRLLHEIANRLLRAAGPADLVARLGGDEFAWLRRGPVNQEAALRLADSMIREIARPALLDGQQVEIAASIGVALFPLHGIDAEQLFCSADLALYHAKAAGRRCARLYAPQLRVAAQSKVLRDTELQAALERGEFEMFYQPQIRLKDGKLAGAEALLRWHHPVHGLLTPAAFLPALEAGLLAARVGSWAAETACRQAARWRVRGLQDFRIGVNLFSIQLRAANLLGWVTDVCATAGLPAAALEIEITETVLLTHEDEIIEALTALRAGGFGVAFDDFGTGFASLSMLTRYPVTRLKIDQRFTKPICESPADAAVIRAVIELGRALDLHITAEGVETAAQAEALAQAGCGEAQGYYFGAPMNAAAFTRMFCAQDALLDDRGE